MGKQIVLKFMRMLEYHNYLQHNDVTIIDKGCDDDGWYVVLAGEKEEPMKLFEKVGKAVDGVLAFACCQTVKAAASAYEAKSPSIKELISVSTTQLKVVATVSKKLIDNGKAKLKAVKDAKSKKPWRTNTKEDTTENYSQ